MNFRQDMLDTIRSRPTPLIPWVPRLDLWYRANKRAGTLPKELRNATLHQIAQALNAGVHAIIPDFKDVRNPQEEIDRGLGVYNTWSMPCHTVFENIQRIVDVQKDQTIVEYCTPAGAVRTVVLYDDQMRRDGITISHIQEHAWKSPTDYAAIKYLFENARIKPNFMGYIEYAQQVGPAGLAAAFVSLAASPMHLIQRDLMPLDKFFFEMTDHPDEMAALAEKIAGYWERLLNVAAKCPAELFLLGANYDSRITYPAFFEQHIMPWLQKFAKMLHPQEKFLLTHTDGENKGLLELYVQCGFDVADSICPEPMTSISFKQTRRAFTDSFITIMGGIPSVALLPQSMSDSQFEAFLDRFFEDVGHGDHLILGISDTTPPAADFRRLITIGRRIKEFGPVSLI